MKKYASMSAAVLAAMAGLGASAFGQCPILLTGSTPNAAEAGTVNVGITGDDVIGTVFFPFNVSLYGVDYDAANVSSNGNIQFASSATAWTNTCPLPSATFLGGPTILAHWDDLMTDDLAPAVGRGIFTSESGAAGSRRFNIEYRARYFGTSTPINFIVSFYENQSYFDVFYVNVPNAGIDASIGVQADGAFGSGQTTFSCNTAGIATSGTSVRYSCTNVFGPAAVLTTDLATGPTGTSFVASAAVTIGNPASLITGVSLNASSIDAGTIAMLDNGVAPDGAAGDGIYSAAVTVGANSAFGLQTLTATATDALGRSASSNSNFFVTPPAASGYSNGPFQTGTGNGFGGGNTSAIEAPFLTFGYTASTASSFAVADDFTVTDAAGWSLNSLTVYAYQTQANPNPISTFTNIRVSIFTSNPNGTQNAPTYGDLTTNRLLSTAFTGVYRVTTTTLTNGQRAIMSITADLSDIPDLAPGTYWVGWTLGGTQASGPFTVPVVPNPAGANAQQRNIGATPTNWDTLNFAAANTTAQDLAFDIDYDVVPAPGAAALLGLGALAGLRRRR